ncbi:hypothetical protein FW774_06075 [Pedobacter sp. BS3]|uniref:hypothetical protein n=1 Tax=Pedobacter sp. BS3 TaxID=2567937 RepID=UPI0011ED22C2|nr:hypothetical protein [Pedobacter sp. BS3]TZF84552.1 hypothetical protein FW774_06075 [Pedobacter sp. BS3]
MRKFLLIAFIAVAATACKKDKDDSPSDLLIGTWVQTKFKVDYYDENDQIKISESDEDVSYLKFDGSNCQGTSGSGNTDNSAYTITSENGKKYISFANPEFSDFPKFEITTLTKSSLVFKVERPHEVYLYEDTNVSWESEKAVYTAEYTKQQ